MIKAAELDRQWELWADTECNGITVIPVFVRGRSRLKAFEMAAHPDGPVVFRSVKRLVDIGDNAHLSPTAYLPFRAMDVAKFSLELALKMMEKWNPELKATGIEMTARS